MTVVQEETVHGQHGRPIWPHASRMAHGGCDLSRFSKNRLKQLDLVRKASGLGLLNYPLFRNDPHFKPLHADPPFLGMLADLRHEWESYRREFGRP